MVVTFGWRACNACDREHISSCYRCTGASGRDSHLQQSVQERDVIRPLLDRLEQNQGALDAGGIFPVGLVLRGHLVCDVQRVSGTLPHSPRFPGHPNQLPVGSAIVGGPETLVQSSRERGTSAGVQGPWWKLKLCPSERDENMGLSALRVYGVVIATLQFVRVGTANNMAASRRSTTRGEYEGMWFVWWYL